MANKVRQRVEKSAAYVLQEQQAELLALLEGAREALVAGGEAGYTDATYASMPARYETSWLRYEPVSSLDPRATKWNHFGRLLQAGGREELLDTSDALVHRSFLDQAGECWTYRYSEAVVAFDAAIAWAKAGDLRLHPQYLMGEYGGWTSSDVRGVIIPPEIIPLPGAQIFPTSDGRIVVPCIDGRIREVQL